jgi:hypothetical protein
MTDDKRNGMIGALLIGVGCGLTAVGFAMVIPACTNWTLDVMDEAVRRGRDTLHSGVETAASMAGHLSGKAQRKFGEASKTARETTAKAAAAVESAARRVREHAS